MNPILASLPQLSLCSLVLLISFCLFLVLLCSLRSYLSFSCSVANDSTGCCDREPILLSRPCSLPICSTIFFERPLLHIPVVHTKLNQQTYTLVFFIHHLLSLDVRVDSCFCLLFGIETDVARGIVNPLNSKMRVRMKIISDFFIRHVINTEQIPSIIANGSGIRSKVWSCPGVEELWE